MPGEPKIEETVAAIFEKRLGEFFDLPLRERLDRARLFFERIEVQRRKRGGRLVTEKVHNFPKLSCVASELVSAIDQNALGLPGSKRQNVVQRFTEDNLKAYFERKWDEIAFLLTPFLLSSYFLFDESGSKILDDALRNDLLKKCGLETEKSRRDEGLRFLSLLLIDQPVPVGGKKKLYEWTPFEEANLMTTYNRLLHVARHAKGRIKNGESMESVCKDLRIPMDLVTDLTTQVSPGNVALEWSKTKLGLPYDLTVLKQKVISKANRNFKNRFPSVKGQPVGVLEENGKLQFCNINPKDGAATKRLKFDMTLREFWSIRSGKNLQLEE